MKVIIPKKIELIASNVAEDKFSLWQTSSTYNIGEKVYELYSDFPELLSYGNVLFDSFTKEPGWTFNGTESKYDCDGTQTTDTLLYQTGFSDKIKAGDSVLVTFQIESYSAGYIAAFAGNVGESGTVVNSAGWYQQVITVGSAPTIVNESNYIGFIASFDFVGSVSNISMKQVGPNIGHKIYECLGSSVTGTLPSQSGDWVKIAASNRWKMFDDYMSSQSERNGKISIKIKARKCDTMAFFEMVATNIEYILSDDSFSETSTSLMTPSTGSKTFTMTTDNSIWNVGDNVEIYRTSDQRTFMAGVITEFDSASGFATVNVTVYDDASEYDSGDTPPYNNWTIVRVYTHESESLFVSSSLGWYDYFFDDIEYNHSVSRNFTARFNTSLRVIFSSDYNQLVKVGHFVVGRAINLGQTQYGLKGGITSFSVKTANDFGEYTLTPRSNANELRYVIWVSSGGEDTVYQTLKQLDAIPCVWDANESGTEYSFAVVFGFFSDFSIGLAQCNYTECDLEIQGLA